MSKPHQLEDKFQVPPNDPATMDQMNATLRRMVKMPPKAHDDMKVGKSKQNEQTQLRENRQVKGKP